MSSPSTGRVAHRRGITVKAAPGAAAAAVIGLRCHRAASLHLSLLVLSNKNQDVQLGRVGATARGWVRVLF